MGSQLCDGDDHVVWGDRYSYTLPRLKVIRLPDTYDLDHLPLHSCGLIKSVNVIPLFWESNVYTGLIKFLKSDAGPHYDKSDILEFSYDWRLSNIINADRLKAFIDSRVKNGKSVDIIAHSMGGLIARVYVQRLGGGSRVKNLIMLGTPHLGSAKIFERLRDGFEHCP
jgi:hypothetical protein